MGVVGGPRASEPNPGGIPENTSLGTKLSAFTSKMHTKIKSISSGIFSSDLPPEVRESLMKARKNLGEAQGHLGEAKNELNRTRKHNVASQGITSQLGGESLPENVVRTEEVQDEPIAELSKNKESKSLIARITNLIRRIFHTI